MKRIICVILYIGLFTLFFLLQSYRCFSQDCSEKKKILILENTSLTNKHHKRICFHQTNRILIERYSTDTISRGVFKIINDTTIKIRNKIVFLNDIKCIRADWGEPVAIFSSPIAAFFLTGSIITSIKYSIVDDPYLPGCEYSLTVAIAGVIGLLTVKTYKLDQDWKIHIGCKKKKHNRV